MSTREQRRERTMCIRQSLGRSVPPAGLGDTVKGVLDATGVGPVVQSVIERVTGKPCRCEERRKLLNKLVPYKQTPPAT